MEHQEFINAAISLKGTLGFASVFLLVYISVIGALSVYLLLK